MTLSIIQTRLCNTCLEEKPITEFRLRSRNGSDRQKQCRECHNQSERLRLNAKRNRHNQREIGKNLTRLSRAYTEAQVLQTCSQMLKQFGGLEGFLQEMIEYQRRSLKKGGFGAYRCIESILRLLRYHDMYVSKLSSSDKAEGTAMEVES